MPNCKPYSLSPDSASIATEYSLKFDESMTEDEIEEKSFRSLLPSESHRRFNMERKRSRQDDSDEETARDQSALTAVKVGLCNGGCTAKAGVTFP